MAGGAWRRVAERARSLRALLRDTARALRDAQDGLALDPEVSASVQDIATRSSRPTALVVVGSSPRARARLVNALLGKSLLPESLPRGCKWLHIQHGATTQVHLTVGNSEFELVEELECNQRPWDTLLLQDILRTEHTDLGTMLEVEINNSFLKDGLRIIVPPDIIDPGTADYASLKHSHSDLYQKRESILKNYSTVYLYAMDQYGRNIFNDNVCTRMSASESDGDFWSTFNLYYMMGSEKVEDKEQISEDLWKDAENSVFSAENCLDLRQVKALDSNSQVFFILFADSVGEDRRRDPHSDATESTESVYCGGELPEDEREGPDRLSQSKWNRRLHEEQTAFMNELLDQWEVITGLPRKQHVKSRWTILDDRELFKNIDKEEHKKKKESGDRIIKTRSGFLNVVLKFATDSSQTYLLDQCTRLSELHVRLLQRFILASFELARELQVLPARIRYAASQERQLYQAINDKFSKGDKKRELVQLMQEVLEEMQTDIQNMDWSVDDLPCHQDKRFTLSNSIFYSMASSQSVDIRLSEMSPEPEPDVLEASEVSEALSDVEEAVSYDCYNFDDFEIIHSSEESYSSDGWGRPQPQSQSQSQSQPCPASVSPQLAALDVQRTVLSKLSQKISLKLVKFVDCLKDGYFGTLQRCLQSLEARGGAGARGASEAARALLGAARGVQLAPGGRGGALRAALDALRRLLRRLRLGSGSEPECCPLSAAWRRRAAASAARRLDPHALAEIISVQILEKLAVAHDRYQSALTSLETALTSRLNHTEDVKLAIRKKYAPSFARLCLESTSMVDLLTHGTPELGREIGRGQYGVVYSVRGGWGGHAPVAVKSVLPADERHYRELAMEFFYTRSIPPHPRLVRVLGSLVSRGASRAVLLVARRYATDLHAAVGAGLAFAARMSVACDIVEGVRYLHSLGLVHRDVKLKNVLLDGQGRAALADLGFCTAGALVSGSLVGTPVHMAPELLAGDYHAAVDVYAFGVLFWYLCAGHVQLPAAFETLKNKEQLWSRVKRGLRPERLPYFSDECWDIMESCWAQEPERRALLGDVQPRLQRLLRQGGAGGGPGGGAGGGPGGGAGGGPGGEGGPAPRAREDSLEMSDPGGTRW